MFADSLHLSPHQRTPSPPPLSSSFSSHRSARLKTSNPSYHRNQQYSIIGLTNAAGILVERYSYTANGTLGIYDASGTVRTTSTYANRYTHTGREYDADLAIYHFCARWYDPATGGFISRDPLGFVDGLSLYRGYFGTKGRDPSGTITYRPDDRFKPHPRYQGALVAFLPDGSPVFKAKSGLVCYTWDGVNKESTREIECPGTRVDPKVFFPDGMKGLLKALELLRGACNCCNRCVHHCSPDECAAEADILVGALLFAWTSNYGYGPMLGEPGPHVGGWYCYEWAVIFRKSIENQQFRCFDVQQLFAIHEDDVNLPDNVPARGHAYVMITPCHRNDCSIIVDDGFLNGEYAHVGEFPPKGSGYEEQGPLLDDVPAGGTAIPRLPR